MVDFSSGNHLKNPGTSSQRGGVLVGDFPATFDDASVMSMTSGDQWDMTQVSEEKRPKDIWLMVINGG